MTFAEWCNVLIACTIILLLLWFILMFIIRHTVACCYYCKFTYEAYLTHIRKTDDRQFDYDDCLRAATILRYRYSSKFTIRKLLTFVIAYFHKRRHPEDYV